MNLLEKLISTTTIAEAKIIKEKHNGLVNPNCCECGKPAANTVSLPKISWRSQPIQNQERTGNSGFLCGRCHDIHLSYKNGFQGDLKSYRADRKRIRQIALDAGFKGVREYDTYMYEKSWAVVGCNNKKEYQAYLLQQNALSNGFKSISEYSKYQVSKKMKKNYQILTYIQYGKELPKEECYCLGNGKKLFEVSAWNCNKLQGNLYLHHLLVNDNTSEHKGKLEPSALLRKDSMEQVDIFELMICVALSDSSHKSKHTHSNTDIRTYNVKQLPWILRTENNYLKGCKKLKLIDIPEYTYLINALINPNVTNDIIAKNNITTKN